MICIFEQSCMWGKIGLIVISFILLNLWLCDLVLGFKHTWSTLNTHHDNCTKEKFILCIKLYVNTICMRKVFFCLLWNLSYWNISLWIYYCWNLGCYTRAAMSVAQHSTTEAWMDVEPNSVNELDDFEDDALWSRHSRPFSVRRSSASLWLVDRVPVVSSRGWSSWPHTGSRGVRPHLGGEGGGKDGG
jgi:hypothetical protein